MWWTSCKLNSNSQRLLVLAVCWICVTPSTTCLEYVTYTNVFGYIESRVCGDIDINTTVPLSCPPNTLFHVIRKRWSDNVTASFQCNNTTEENMPASSATYGSVGSPPLSPQCRGRMSHETSAQLCNETVQIPKSFPGRKITFYEVQYECVHATNVHNVCEDIPATTLTDYFIHLVSPSLLSSSPVSTVSNTCMCTLSTSGKIVVYFIRLDMSPEDWNATCDSCQTELQKFTEYPVVNIITLWNNNTNGIQHYEVKINDDQNTKHRKELWIVFRMDGGNGATLQCSRERLTLPETTSQTATQVVTSPSLSKGSGPDDVGSTEKGGNSDTGAIAGGTVAAVAIVGAVGAGGVIFAKKRKQGGKNTTKETKEQQQSSNQAVPVTNVNSESRVAVPASDNPYDEVSDAQQSSIRSSQQIYLNDGRTGPYSSLNPADINVPSEYSGLETPPSKSDPGMRGNYESLNMVDVNVPSIYS